MARSMYHPSRQSRFALGCGLLLILAMTLGGGEPAAVKPAPARAALLRVLAMAEDIVSNTGEYYVVRRDAAMAVNRVHQALGDWGGEEQLAWYMRRVEDEPQDVVQEELFSGALAAARGGRLHLGGVRAFCKRMDAAFNERDRKLKYRAQRMRERLARYMRELPRRCPRLDRFKPIRVNPPDLRPLTRLKALPGK